ncbi:MAG: diguanylate cyclase [Chloroflexota bacterium]
MTALAVVAIGVVAVAIAWTADGHIHQWVTRMLASRATSGLDERILVDLGPDDFNAHAGDKVATLAHRLAQAHANGEGDLIQVNIYAPDGTILFSGTPERIGRKVLPSRVPRLAGALAGTVNTRLLALSPTDDADLTAQYTDVLAVYAPVTRDGQVVAASEVYTDPTPLRLARLATWLAVIGPVTIGLLLYVRKRQVEQADQIDHLIGAAFFDSLTGLANRALFRFRLQQAFYRAQRRRDLLIVMFLDLDRFKQINDTLGHAAGDQLLKAVGERLLANVRPEDTIARLGGDEFTVLLEEVPSLDDVIVIANRILAAMRQPFILAGESRTVRVSIGIAARTEAHLKPEDVLNDADVALYQSKEGGRDRYTIFEAEMSSQPTPISKAS